MISNPDYSMKVIRYIIPYIDSFVLKFTER